MSLLPWYTLSFLVAPTITSILLNLVMYVMYFAPSKENVQSFRIGFGKVWQRFQLPLIKSPIEICYLPFIKSDIILSEDSTFYHKSEWKERSVVLIVVFQAFTFSLLFLGIPILCFLLEGEGLLMLFLYLGLVFASLAFIPTIGVGLFVMAGVFGAVFRDIFSNQFFASSIDSILYPFVDPMSSATTSEDILSFVMSLIMLMIGYATLHLLIVFPSTLGGKLILPLFDAMPRVGEAPDKEKIRRKGAVISIFVYMMLMVVFALFFNML